MGGDKAEACIAKYFACRAAEDAWIDDEGDVAALWMVVKMGQLLVSATPTFDKLVGGQCSLM